MTPEHYTQKLDFGGNGYLITTRDDTDEIQDFYLKAFLPDNTLVRQIRFLYNIKYDYYREQIWCLGELVIDILESFEDYGHLQYEQIFNSDFVNPYPDNFEPVKPEGCDMFRWEGYSPEFELFENKIIGSMHLYIYNDLQEWRKPEYSRGKIIDARIENDLETLKTLEYIELRERKYLTMKFPMRLLYDITFFIQDHYAVLRLNLMSIKLPSSLTFIYDILEILHQKIFLKICDMFDILHPKILSKVPLKPSCDPKIAKKQRIKFLKRHSKYIGVTVPYDSRFMD